MTSLNFKLLESLKERLEVYPLYKQLNSHLSEADFIDRMREMETESGYKLLAGYMDNRLVAISGFWISHKLYCGKYLEPDNVVVDARHRSEGIGTQLHRKLESIARENQCRAMMLDAYLDNNHAHRFYERHGYQREGYHFVRTL